MCVFCTFCSTHQRNCLHEGMRSQAGWKTSRIHGCGAGLFAHTSTLTPRWREEWRGLRGLLTWWHGSVRSRWMNKMSGGLGGLWGGSLSFFSSPFPAPVCAQLSTSGGGMSVTSHFPRIEGLPFPMPPSPPPRFTRPPLGFSKGLAVLPFAFDAPMDPTLALSPTPPNIAWLESIEGARTQSTRVQAHPLDAASRWRPKPAGQLTSTNAAQTDRPGRS